MNVTVMEIALLIVSAVGFVVSFLIPDAREKNSGMNEELAQEEIQKLIRQEVDAARGHVDEVIEETMNYAVEKTERSLERLSNEKIMAVSDYSDTVMQEIHKNHEEVVFLYDMLNNKHENLRKTVAEASKAAKVMQDTVESIQTFRPVEAVSASAGKPEEGAEAKQEETPPVRKKKAAEKPAEKKTASAPRRKRKEEPEAEPAAAEAAAPAPAESKAEVQLGGEDSRNSNEKILELHRSGKSNVAIAKELGLGVGEVKLVLDLYKNM